MKVPPTLTALTIITLGATTQLTTPAYSEPVCDDACQETIQKGSGKIIEELGKFLKDKAIPFGKGVQKRVLLSPLSPECRVAHSLLAKTLQEENIFKSIGDTFYENWNKIDANDKNKFLNFTQELRKASGLKGAPSKQNKATIEFLLDTAPEFMAKQGNTIGYNCVRDNEVGLFSYNFLEKNITNFAHTTEKLGNKKLTAILDSVKEHWDELKSKAKDIKQIPDLNFNAHQPDKLQKNKTPEKDAKDLSDEQFFGDFDEEFKQLEENSLADKN